jgi:regulator of protease activity HflC (stomatin/prohibitin superfamily)
MDKSESVKGLPPAAASSRPHRFLRRLVWLYGCFAVAAGAFLSVAVWPIDSVQLAKALATEAVRGGVGAMTISALLLALTGLVGTLALTAARQPLQLADDAAAQPISRWLQRRGPGFAARTGQGVIVPLGAVLIYAFAWLLWPTMDSVTQAAADANFLAAFAFALGFVSLVAERMMNAFPEPQMPEAPSLRRLLLVTTVVLAAAGCVEAGRGAGLMWIEWPALASICIVALIATELALRSLARLFLPAPSPAMARAATDSVVATVLTGGPRAPSVLIRTHLGLDFTRSWALAYLSAAALPAVLATTLLVWGLSGLKLIDLGERGVYERFGAPVSVLGPGLHLLLPWPLGRLRPVEYDTIHTVAVGVDKAGAADEEEQIDAEATPPAIMNHLWETAQPTEAQYLVASQSGSQQGFQVVSAEIRVLYRTGLTDLDAKQAVYGAVDQEALVREAASRLLVRYFNSRTLDAVLGARRESLAEELRSALARNIAARNAGIEIVAVTIEAIHPPVGAAAAYHAVQAAEIKAQVSVSDETGRAKRMAGVAQQESRQLIDSAQATATEALQAATGEAYRFSKDREAYKEGPAFLLERSYSNLVGALKQTPLTILDHRLDPAQSPVIDLRSAGAPGLPPAPAAPSAAPGSAAPGSATPAAPAARPVGRAPAGGNAPSAGSAPSLTPQIDGAN